MGPYVTGTRYGFSSPLEGEVAAQRSEGGAAEGYLPKPQRHIRLRRFTPSQTLPPQGGGDLRSPPSVCGRSPVV